MNVQTMEKAANKTIAGADRRRHTRYRLAIPIVIYRENTAEIAGMTLEISESGLSALLANPLRENETVHIGPIGGGKVSARVRHCVGRVHGFEFVDLPAEQISKIKEQCQSLPRYLANRLGI
jgi:hypothetical protein